MTNVHTITVSVQAQSNDQDVQYTTPLCTSQDTHVACKDPLKLIAGVPQDPHFCRSRSHPGSGWLSLEETNGGQARSLVCCMLLYLSCLDECS